MKRIASLLLSVIIICSLIIPAVATEIESASGMMDSVSIDLSDKVQLNISFPQETQANSSITPFEIEQYNEGRLVVKVMRSNDGRFLLGTEYDDAGTIIRTYTIDLAEHIQRNSSTPSSAVPNSTVNGNYVIGLITFNPIVGQTTSERLRVHCNHYDHDYESYTVNGRATQSLADIAGILISLLISFFTSPVELADYVAVAIVSFFGGEIAGREIGVNFSETVAVVSDYYKFSSYKLSAGIYSMEYSGISRRVITEKSQYYGQWFHEGITPSTWKNDNTFALWCWNDLYADIFPGVKSYS